MMPPMVNGFILGILFSAMCHLVWRDVIKPVIMERRRKSWEDFRANLKWPPPPGWAWREDQRRLVRR